MLCNAVACPDPVRSGTGTTYSRSASAYLYHAGSRLTSCDGAVDCMYKRYSSIVGTVLSITFVLRAVLCAVKNKATKKKLFFLDFCFIE